MRSTLAALLLLLLPDRALATPDEPGIAPSRAPAAPETPGQVIDIEPPHAAPPCRTPTPIRLVRPARVDRGPFVRLSLGGGYTGFATLFAEDVHGAAIHGTLAMTFGGGRVKHGIRVGGYFLPRMEGEVHSLFGSAWEAESRAWGANISYVAQWSSFWLSAGWGAIHLDTEEHGYYNSSHDCSHSSLYPEAIFGLGFDIPVSRTVSLRLAGELGTFFVSYRASASTGLVLRF
jgi:hypothetical protein